jgi:hypothetical protein
LLAPRERVLARVTRCVREKVAQTTAQIIFLPNLIHNLHRVRLYHKNVRRFCDFLKTAQSRQPPGWRKFTQSGRPGWGLGCTGPKFTPRNSWLQLITILIVIYLHSPTFLSDPT